MELLHFPVFPVSGNEIYHRARSVECGVGFVYQQLLYAGILDLLLAKQYSAAKEQILILVVTVVLVSLTARACELMFRHYTEPSALETKKKTAQKTF